MKVVVGLGNPGREFKNTRHNIGFEVIDELAKRYNEELTKIKFKSLYTEARIGGQKILLMKPTTYMNNSGEALREVMDFYKLDPEDIFVIYDDIDLPTGQIRIRKKGSSGSHNGLRSIVKHLGSENFPRLRIGIGRGDHRMALKDYVLGKFTEDELVEITPAIRTSCDAIETIVREDLDAGMNKYNVK